MKLQTTLIWFSIVTCLAVLLWQWPNTIPTANMVQHQFTIGDSAFVISLPPEFQNNPDHSSVQFLRAGYRVPRNLTFTMNPPPLTSSSSKLMLRNGGILKYAVNANLGGDSGGSEAELVGQIIFESLSIGVIARDQDEFSPEPEWCIEYLHTLQLK